MSGCDEFNRGELFRRAAVAGKGLPSIEPGMPEPAGTRIAELAGFGGSRPAYQMSLPAACAKTGGVSPVKPRSRLPTASASRICGPAGNSTHFVAVPGSRASISLRSRTTIRLTEDFW